MDIWGREVCAHECSAIVIMLDYSEDGKVHASRYCSFSKNSTPLIIRHPSPKHGKTVFGKGRHMDMPQT